MISNEIRADSQIYQGGTFMNVCIGLCSLVTSIRDDRKVNWNETPSRR